MWNKALIPAMSRGLLFVVSAPAGTGKTTLVRRLVEAFPTVVHIPSVTTRPKREGEEDGVDYYFVTKEEFHRRSEEGEFLEQIEFHRDWYATSKREIEKRRAEGRHVVLVLDTRGALTLKQQLDPILIFIKPPSLEVLEQRLVERGSEDEPSLRWRLEWAKREMADEPQFHYSVVNDQFDDAFNVLVSIVVAESHKNIMR